MEIRKQIPSIVKEVGEVRKQIPNILEEVKEVRQQIPVIIEEVEKIRSLVPFVLDEVKITGDSGKSLFRDLRNNAEDVSDEDIELIKVALNQVLSSGQMGHTQKWSNPQSGNDGIVTLKKSVEIDKRNCRIIGFKIRIDNEERINRDVTFCLNGYSEWKAME